MNPYSPPNPIDSEHRDEAAGWLIDVVLVAISIGFLIGASLLIHFVRG